MFDIEELNAFKYRIDRYNIYHVYFYDIDDCINRLFLGGNIIEEWFYKEKKIILINETKVDVIKLLNKYKKELPWTLDLESLYL